MSEGRVSEMVGAATAKLPEPKHTCGHEGQTADWSRTNVLESDADVAGSLHQREAELRELDVTHRR